MFDNKWITIEAKHLMHNVDPEDSDVCIFLIAAGQFEFGIFGLPLFQGYYSHHDMQNMFVEFGPMVGSGTPIVVEGIQPTTPITEAG